MIRIHQGYVSDADGISTLSTEIDIDNEKKDVRISVGSEYGKFLSPERADYALIGLLAYALRNKHDIICEAPVTEELLFNINEFLIPTLVRSDERNYPVKIQADIAPPLDKLPFAKAKRGGVGTGISCGVDSFYTVLKHYNTDYPSRNLTHLCVFNNGSISPLYGDEEAREIVREKIFERAEAVAKELNLPLIKLETNLQTEIPQNHLRSHTYMDGLAIYALQKLWQGYYYGSTYSFKGFSLERNFNTDPAHFEGLLLDCFSTSKLKIYSSGAEGERNDKMDFIVDNPLVQKYLHVCLRQPYNCGRCKKCRRTLLSLDAANKLENFREVFNIRAYFKRRERFYAYMNELITKDEPEGEFFAEIYKVLYERHKEFFDNLNAEKKII